MLVLTQFVLRLAFGLSLAMALTSPRRVTSGFYRNHAYVLLGLNVLALLAAFADPKQLSIWAPLAGAVLSYACAVTWLYEKAKPGRALLILIAAAGLIGACVAQQLPGIAIDGNFASESTASKPVPAAAAEAVTCAIWKTNVFTSGLLLGSTIAAMFLGHWYLNSPTMEIAPLRKLLVLMLIALVLQSIVSAGSLGLESQLVGLKSNQYPLLALRWLAGIFGTAALTYMTWQTLKIPNTQSATGILYVAVLATFLGELTSLLLSAGTAFPI
jgi:hypothetical protein